MGFSLPLAEGLGAFGVIWYHCVTVLHQPRSISIAAHFAHKISLFTTCAALSYTVVFKTPPTHHIREWTASSVCWYLARISFCSWLKAAHTHFWDTEFPSPLQSYQRCKCGVIRGNFPDFQCRPEQPEQLNEKEKASLPRVKVGNMEIHRKDINKGTTKQWSEPDISRSITRDKFWNKTLSLRSLPFLSF